MEEQFVLYEIEIEFLNELLDDFTIQKINYIDQNLEKSVCAYYSVQDMFTIWIIKR
jgi:hypothetical protein